MGGGWKWVTPEVYPIIGSMTLAIGWVVWNLGRNITGNPEVRVRKRDRSAGYVENFEEGEKYFKGPVRTFISDKSPQIFTKLNEKYTKPDDE